MNTNDGYDIKYFLRPIRDNKVFFVSIFSLVMIICIYFSVTLKKYWISEVIITPVSSMITHEMNIALPNYSYINNKWESEDLFKPQFFIDEYIKLFSSEKEKKNYYLQYRSNSNNKYSFEKLSKELFYRYDQKKKEYIFYAKTINSDYGHDLIINYTKYIYKKMREEIEISEKERNQEELMILNKKLLIQKMIADNNKNEQLYLLRKGLLENKKINIENNNFLILKSEIQRQNKIKQLYDLINTDYDHSLQFYNDKISPIEINIKLIRTYLNNMNISKEKLIKIDNRSIRQFKTSNYSNIFILLASMFLAAIIAMISSIIKFSFRRYK